jgi:hypothetical protein
VALRPTIELRLGERVMLGGHVFVLRGLAPMSAFPRWVQLEDEKTGGQVEAWEDELDGLDSQQR